MPPLFTQTIRGWDSWCAAARSIDVWQPLVRHIFALWRLPFHGLAYLTPSTNAVFKAGSYVIKIFAPVESDIGGSTDFASESYALRRVSSLGIPIPRYVADGYIEDTYKFAYLVTEYVEGTTFTAYGVFTEAEKLSFGQKLRAVTDRMNTPCEVFNGIDVIHDTGRHRCWDVYPAGFKAERLAYLDARAYGEKVFVHGDLGGDNILMTGPEDFVLLDFAEAAAAPLIYEHAQVASELFRFDHAFLRGYFGSRDPAELTELCLDGLLIHDFGGDIIQRHVARPAEITGIAVLRDKLFKRIRS